MTYPHVLMLDVAGLPVDWIHWQTAATLYARDKVVWEAGESSFVLTGGTRSDGSRSTLRINSIIATRDRSSKSKRTPAPTGRAIFSRDRHICLYCGQRYPASRLSVDHVTPKSRNGSDSWENLATACSGPTGCNARKGARTPEEAGMPLLALPYRPDPAAYMLLMVSGRRVLADQQAFLEAFADKKAARRLS